ncbi:MAG: hypothetical protein ACRD3R_09245 [Terriglobales bacterium]
MQLRPYSPSDEDAVIELWQRCELTRPWNDPRKDIQRKLTTQPELFLARGCPKLNIQVRASNKDVLEFYRKIGYAPDEAVSLGKRLIPDLPQR